MNWLKKYLIGMVIKKVGGLNFLQGYKTYIVCGGALAVAAIGLTGGAALIPGLITIPAMDIGGAIDIAWKALALITVHKKLDTITESPSEPNVVIKVEPTPPPDLNQIVVGGV